MSPSPKTLEPSFYLDQILDWLRWTPVDLHPFVARDRMMQAVIRLCKEAQEWRQEQA